MPVLNPFLRALFQSSALSQALSSQSYVLLVPTTESLLNGFDRESNKVYEELVDDEDFLGSHILRIESDQHVGENNIRESRGKAKSYSTVNNKSIIIREGTAYSNKGYKHLNQVQLLQDQLYYSPGSDQQQWLLYYISRPLLGLYEHIVQPVPMLNTSSKKSDTILDGSEISPQGRKKAIKSFGDLLTTFPMIARQMQPSLDRVFLELAKVLTSPVSTSTAPGQPSHTIDSSTTPVLEEQSQLSQKLHPDHEDVLRTPIELAITTVIDSFQAVDKSQLSLLGSTTDLTGSAVERLIERYIVEYVNDHLLFPSLCSLYRGTNHELDSRINQMRQVDVAQVGIELEPGHKAKTELLARIHRGVDCFRKMNTAAGPQQMLDILLQTQKTVSEVQPAKDEEKAAAMTVNADILVSLLLVVVIRSGVHHLQTRLVYMQRFNFIEEVESGEAGYSLSTFEAVLSYILSDSVALRRASKRNTNLWNAVKKGRIEHVQAIFDDKAPALAEDDLYVEPSPIRPTLSRASTKSSLTVGFVDLTDEVEPSVNSNLAHVFPFESETVNGNPTKRKKKVRLSVRSMSISSSNSVLSRVTTLHSISSGIEGDTSIDSLAQTQDPAGNSILMMAVEANQPDCLSFLLSLNEYYTPSYVVEDTNSSGMTLFSVAVQAAATEVLDVLLAYLDQHSDSIDGKAYISRQDDHGRSAAHYLFHTPGFISRIADCIPWRLRDHLGQTPLFAVCRSYDHPHYADMVSEALVAAKVAQHDGQALDLAAHTDNRGNTLLHIVSDARLLHRILRYSDIDPNCVNDRRLTPLMLASKYGRTDIVRIFFDDPRIDLYLREFRGLTAVELAKDDEVRNKIDDLTLFSDSATSQSPDSSGRITSIVRSFFVEDGTTRYVLKSGAPHQDSSSLTYTITTCRRSLRDFQLLVKWLSSDHAASYLPTLLFGQYRSPFQIHSRPSKAVLQDMQVQLDRFLKILISHPTFSAHESLWEFILVPDLLPDQVQARTKLKTEYLEEKISDSYETLSTETEMQGVESIMSHSRDIVRRLSVNVRNMIRRGYVLHQSTSDLAEAMTIASSIITTLGPPSTTLLKPHVDAFAKYAGHLHTEPPSSPLVTYCSALTSLLSTLSAMSGSLTHPTTQITSIRNLQRQLIQSHHDLSDLSTPRKPNSVFGINLPGLEDARLRNRKIAEDKVRAATDQIEEQGKELRYTQEIVLGELAGWTTWREQWSRNEIRRFVKRTIVKEKLRLSNLKRVVDELQKVEVG